MSILTSIISSQVNARNRIALLAQKMINGVDSRLVTAATPSTSMKLFTGLGSSYTGSTYTPNNQNWINDLRGQLTGYHMGAGNWTQSYALIPLGDRFVLNVAHNGPEPLPLNLKYVKSDGTVFTTTATHWINDRPGALSSDTKQPYVTDLMIYVLSTPLPSWVSRNPILNIPSDTRTKLSKYNPPIIGVTQGNWNAGPASPYGYADTPDNRMVRVANMNGNDPSTALRTPFFHYGVVGDSGCPDYAVIDDIIYLAKVVTTSGGSGLFVCDHISYINSLIARGATAAGISPITISAVNPILD